jgi:PAS domain S-box-containing protein
MLPALAPGVPTWLLIVNWLNDTIKILLAAVLVRRFAPRPLRFTTLRAMGVYLVCAVLVAPVLSAFVGAAGLATLGTPYWQAWRTWFLGDALASLVVTPTIVMWATVGRAGLHPPSRQRAAESLLLAAALLVVGSLFVISRVTLVMDDALYYLPIPLLVWAAVRVGPRGIASALTVVTCFAIVSLAGFWGLVPSTSTPREVLSLQLFLIATAVPLLLLAAQIEERKQVVEALRGSEARFRAAFVSAATGMMLVDSTGHFLQVNRPLVEMLGYSEAELRTHTVIELTYPDDQEADLALLQQVLVGETDSYHIEKRFLHKEGNLVWGLVSAGVVRDAAGHPLYLVSQLEDITARKRLEQEREAAHAEAEQHAEQLDRLFEAVADGIAVYDQDGREIRTNAALQRLLRLDVAPPTMCTCPCMSEWPCLRRATSRDSPSH